MYIFAYAQPDSDASNFLCEARVRGLIYGGAGRPAWRFGHRQTFFQNVLPGFLGFGHRRLIQRICSPWFSVYLIDIGHRRQFALICSPCFPVKKAEQIRTNVFLYPMPDKPWGTIQTKSAAMPKISGIFKKTRGTNM